MFRLDRVLENAIHEIVSVGGKRQGVSWGSTEEFLIETRTCEISKPKHP
jgi:hypothetical protein